MKEQITPADEFQIDCPICRGDGIDIDVRLEPDCCGRPLDSGECCGNPVPKEEPYPVQCEFCRATGKVYAVEHYLRRGLNIDDARILVASKYGLSTLKSEQEVKEAIKKAYQQGMIDILPMQEDNEVLKNIREVSSESYVNSLDISALTAHKQHTEKKDI